MMTLRFDPSMESRPIREIAYEVLKNAIIAGEIPAGERIVETDYADRLHISRTPLREALRKLERDGLVEYVLRRGVVVKAFTLADVDEIYTIRNALEMLTLPAIVEKATEDDIASLRERLAEMDAIVEGDSVEELSPLARAFHAEFTNICGQNRILRVLESQDQYITRFSSISIAQENRRTAAHQEHHEMVNLLEKRDLKGLEALVAKHIERSKQKCLAAISSERSKHI